MSLQELERDILNLPPDERARLAEWLNNLPSNGTSAPQYPSQEREEVPEGYVGSAEYYASVEAIKQGIADGEAGRVTPFAEWQARFRARHGITDDTQPLSPAELDALP